MLSECVELLWTLYDSQDLGYLDREQSKLFVEDALLGRDFHHSSDGSDGIDDLSDQEYNSIFSKIDTDGNGTLSKDEMVEFLKLLTGL